MSIPRRISLPQDAQPARCVKCNTAVRPGYNDPCKCTRAAKHPLIGTRVELSPGHDLWARGAKFGTVTAVDVKKQIVTVRMDNRNVRKLQRFDLSSGGRPLSARLVWGTHVYSTGKTPVLIEFVGQGSRVHLLSVTAAEHGGRASVRKMGDHDLDFWIDCSSMEHSDGAGYREAI